MKPQEGFSWGSAVKNPLRRSGFNPWCRKILHIAEQLWTRTTEPVLYVVDGPQLLKLVHPRACALQQEKPPEWEAGAPQLESSPRWQQWRLSTANAKKIKLKQQKSQDTKKEKLNNERGEGLWKEWFLGEQFFNSLESTSPDWRSGMKGSKRAVCMVVLRYA